MDFAVLEVLVRLEPAPGLRVVTDVGVLLEFFARVAAMGVARQQNQRLDAQGFDVETARQGIGRQRDDGGVDPVFAEIGEQRIRSAGLDLQHELGRRHRQLANGAGQDTGKRGRDRAEVELAGEARGRDLGTHAIELADDLARPRQQVQTGFGRHRLVRVSIQQGRAEMLLE